MSVIADFLDVESETGSAEPGRTPDSQPRRVRKGRRGLLGFLDDLRTRVKPTRGVLDLSAASRPKGL
jgi:hypothetical protein